MRVLFDQAVPVPIRSHLQGHEVRRAAELGWDTLQNGELLAAAETAGFEVFVTTDKNIRYQQNANAQSQLSFSGSNNGRDFDRTFGSWRMLSLRQGQAPTWRSNYQPTPNPASLHKPRWADGTARESVWESFGFAQDKIR